MQILAIPQNGIALHPNTTLIKRKSILIVAHRFPLPLVGGDHVKLYHVLRHLAKAHTVTFVSADAEHCATENSIAQLSELGIDVHIARFNPLHAWMRVLRGLLSRVPLEMWYYNDSRIKKMVAEILKTKKFDLACAFFLRSAQYFPEYLSLPKILIAEDSRYLLERRATEHGSFSFEYVIRKLDSIRLRTYETHAMKSFSHITFVTQRDQRDVLERGPSLPTSILTNGIDLERFPFTADQAHRTGIIFCGRMDVYHNVLIAERLAKKIMPLVWNHFPRATLTIAGSSPGMRVKKLASQRIIVTGYLSDIKYAITHSQVFAHPQTVGAGIQNKLLEAMALGTAIVTTPIGCSGIDIRDGVHALTREHDEEFAEAICSLLEHDQMRTTLTKNARLLIEEKFSWNDVLRALDELIASF